MSLLFILRSFRSVKIVEILDEHQVESKAVYDKYRMTPLHHAVLNGHCNLARMLHAFEMYHRFLSLKAYLVTGCNVFVLCGTGYYIQKDKLDPEKPDGIRKERPLVTALYNQDIAMIRMLVLDIEANVSRKINNANTRNDGNEFVPQFVWHI